MKIFRLHRWRLFSGLLVVGLVQRLSPWARAQDTVWLQLNGIPEPSLGLEVDGSEEHTRISGVNSTYDALYITPTIGLRTSGSIYHPNLLTFDFDGELGWGWDRMTSTSPGYNLTINENEDLLRYFLQMNLFQEKPANASFFAAQDHTYRDYGSFDTFAVDSSRYGGKINWVTANLNLTADFGYRDETDTGLNDSSEVQETYFNFLGINQRQFGQTTLTLRWDMFDNILNFGNSLNSVNESVGISDSETFGRRKQITATTGASVSHSEYGSQQMDTINASENVTIHHTPALDTYMVMTLELNNLHPATDTQFQGIYGIRHQLYESLTSSLEAQGSYQDSSDSANSSTTDIFGLQLSENYTKRLQSWGRLSIAASTFAAHQDDTSSGGTFTSIAETHQLYLSTSPQYRPVYLNRPQVAAGSVQVTAGGQLLIEGSDYQLITSGQLTEVQLIVPPSSHLQTLLGASDNLAVSVTYQSQAQDNASYESLNSNFQIRLDLPHGFGIYARMSWLDNNAPPQVLTQTLNDYVFGADYKWRWFYAGAEYEDYDSNFSQYTVLQFYQKVDFPISHRSTLNVGLNESFYHYAQTGDQTQYMLTTRYSIQLWSSLSWYLQGGASWQNLLGIEQLQGSAQTGLTWHWGKLNVRAGYEYNDQSTTSGLFTEERDKNRIFAYLKRTF